MYVECDMDKIFFLEKMILLVFAEKNCFIPLFKFANAIPQEIGKFPMLFPRV